MAVEIIKCSNGDFFRAAYKPKGDDTSYWSNTPSQAVRKLMDGVPGAEFVAGLDLKPTGYQAVYHVEPEGATIRFSVNVETVIEAHVSETNKEQLFRKFRVVLH